MTFLPLLETPCKSELLPSKHLVLGYGGCRLTNCAFRPGAFDLLVYTDKDMVVPEKWVESGPQIIDQSEEVRLRSFTTSIHKVNSMVAYKRTDSF